MKKLLLLLVVLLGLAYFGYKYFFKSESATPEVPKQAPISAVKHSEAFNKSVQSVIDSYLSVKDAFIEGDTLLVKKNARLFIKSLDSINIDELKKDSAAIVETAKASIGDIKANAQSLLQQTDITEMRRDFNMMTEMMYPAFFKNINYEGTKLFIHFSQNAFGEGQGATWLSNSSEILNPYFGKNHPQFKSSMLNNGEVKDSVMSQ